jgi:hypothetical protein
LIVVCSGPKLLFFVINSNIHKYIEIRPELKKCQVIIPEADYDFLDHDSFIDCSNVIDSIDGLEIINQIGKDLSRLKGELNKATKILIIAAVQTAKTVSPYHKKLIIGALSL